jgi:hypothetical protein
MYISDLFPTQTMPSASNLEQIVMRPFLGVFLEAVCTTLVRSQIDQESTEPRRLWNEIPKSPNILGVGVAFAFSRISHDTVDRSIAKLAILKEIAEKICTEREAETSAFLGARVV